MNTELNIKQLVFFMLAFLLVYLTALPVDVINVDAAQYASISRNMLHSDNWLQVYDRGHDYLDKPPLLFWLSALSFKALGVSNWAYKLPSFLFAILGLYSTIRLGELLYDKKTGLVAGVMFISCVGLFVITNDVRTDTILIGAIAFSVWQILLYLKTKRWLHLLAGFAGIGVGMLAKGPLGLMIPVFVLASEFAYKRQWKNFVRWQWLVGLVLVAIILAPMTWGLYQQFDMHPEKVVNQSTNVSGVRFFYWTQSFGRITGDSDWGTKFDNGAGPFFLVHSFLWAFFPWSLLVLGGLLKTIIVLIKSRFRSGYLPELATVGGFIIMFIALSASRYKLPHYIFVTFPFAAIIAARFFMNDVLRVGQRFWRIVVMVLHSIFVPALFVLCGLLVFVVFNTASWVVVLLTLCCVVLALLTLRKSKTSFERLTSPLFFGLLAVYLVGNLHFYPNLLRYQSTAEAGKYIASQQVKAGHYFYYRDLFQYPGDFYSGMDVEYMSLDRLDSTLKDNAPIWLYTDESGYDDLKQHGYHINTEKKLDDYSVQFLTTNFLNPNTRASVLRKRFLLELK